MPAGLIALALGGFGIGLTEFTIMGLLPEVAADFGVSEAAAGWLITGYALAVIVGALSLMCGALYYRLIWTRGWLLSPIVTTYVAWQELFVLLSSVEGYRRGSVTWKDRPVARLER